jgi:hypothetical protein
MLRREVPPPLFVPPSYLMNVAAYEALDQQVAHQSGVVIRLGARVAQDEVAVQAQVPRCLLVDQITSTHSITVAITNKHARYPTNSGYGRYVGSSIGRNLKVARRRFEG